MGARNHRLFMKRTWFVFSIYGLHSILPLAVVVVLLFVVMMFAVMVSAGISIYCRFLRSRQPVRSLARSFTAGCWRQVPLPDSLGSAVSSRPATIQRGDRETERVALPGEGAGAAAQVRGVLSTSCPVDGQNYFRRVELADEYCNLIFCLSAGVESSRILTAHERKVKFKFDWRATRRDEGASRRQSSAQLRLLLSFESQVKLFYLNSSGGGGGGVGPIEANRIT